MNSRKLGFAAVAGLMAALALGVVVNGANAQRDGEPGKIGDKAPEIAVTEWIQGDPITLKSGEGEKVFLIEFWATWCPPCRTSIPHLTELYKAYRDRGLEIVAITDESPDTVKSFVTAQGDKMPYPVAIDGNGEMAKKFMEAFGQNGIPHAFVVDTKGSIVWHGHPMDDKLKSVLEKQLPAKPDSDH